MSSTVSRVLNVIFGGDSSKYVDAVKKHVAASKDLLESENKVKKELSGLVGDLGRAQNAQEALTAGIDRLSETFQVGLAASVGVGVGIAISDRIKASAEDLNRTIEAVESIGSQSANNAAKDLSTLQAEMRGAQAAGKGLEDQLKKLNESRVERMVVGANSLVGGDSVDEHRSTLESLQASMQEEERRRVEAIRDLELQRVEAIRLQNAGAGEVVEQMSRQRSRVEEIASAEAMYGEQAWKVLEAIKARHSVEDAGLQRTKQLRENMVDITMRQAEISRLGYDVELRTARETLAAKKLQVKMADNSEARRSAQIEVYQAETALKNAEKSRALRLSEAILAREIASTNGDADAKRMRQLELEKQFLEYRRRYIDTPDARVGTDTALLQKNAEIEQQRKAMEAKAFRERALDIDTGAGRGEAAELSTMRHKLALLDDQIEAERTSVDFNSETYKQLVLQGKQMQREIEDKRLSIEQTRISLALQQEENAIAASGESENVQKYMTTLATITAVTAELEAVKGVNSELARGVALRKEALQAELANQIEGLNKGKSQKEIRERWKEQRNEKRDSDKFRDKMADNEGLIPEKRGLDGEVIEGRDPVTGKKVTLPRASPLNPENRKRKIDTNPGRIDEQRKAGDEEFRKQFQGKAERDAMDAQKAQEEKDREGQWDQKGKDPVVDKLDEIKKELKTLSLR